MRSYRKALSWGIVVLLVSSLSVACEDDGDGDGGQLPGDVNPQGAATAVDSVLTNFFEENDALSSLDALGAFIQGVTASPSVAAAGALDVRRVQEVGAQIRTSIDRLREIRSPRVDSGAGLTAASIPDTLLGETMIWDPNANQGEGGYVVDPEATGAPANGVRFRLYSIFDGLPDPQLDIGYIDIIDNSTPPTIDVDLVAVVNDATLLDYSVTGTFGETTFSLNMVGSVGDGDDQLDFQFTIGGDGSGSQSAVFSMTIGPLFVSFDFSGDETGAGSVASIIANTDTEDVIELLVSFDANGNVQSGSGVLINDTEVAVISGNVDSASISASDGSPLTNQQLAALAALFNGLGELFDVMVELFGLGLGITGFAVFT